MSMSPMFSWLPESATTGATVDVCRDRACQNIIVSFAATGSSAQPPQPLPPGSPAGPASNPSLTITAEQGFGFSVAGM
jgi:hypothetical protein